MIGEGAGALVLEEYEHARARGAHIYAEIGGAAMTADAYHMTATHPEGLGAYKAMQLALDEAGINPEDLDYLNAHATSTPVGDLSEIRAVAEAAHRIAADTHKALTGLDHPDAPVTANPPTID